MFNEVPNGNIHVWAALNNDESDNTVQATIDENLGGQFIAEDEPYLNEGVQDEINQQAAGNFDELLGK